MTDSQDENLEKMVIRHEGSKGKMYLDTKGIPSIAVGRNIRDVGLSLDEIKYLLKNDLASRRAELRAAFSWFDGLSDVRKDAIIDMCFMGVERFKEFKQTIAALASGDFIKASNEMLCSAWAGQVGDRAAELSYMIRENQYR